MCVSGVGGWGGGGGLKYGMFGLSASTLVSQWCLIIPHPLVQLYTPVPKSC